MAILGQAVQEGSITLDGTTTENTATITSVDTTKAIVVPGGWTDTNTLGSDIEENMPRLDLQDATTVRARRDTAAGNTIVVYFTVIEFDEIVDGVEEGEINLTGLSATATISSVDTSRSAVLSLGEETTENGNDWVDAISRVELTNGTTVTATKDSTAKNSQHNFVVVEFASSAIESVQQDTIIITSPDTTGSATISAVTMANTILFWGGILQDGGTSDVAADVWCNLELTSTTNVAATRGQTDNDPNINFTVIEFVSGVLESINRGTEDFASTDTTKDVTISSVDLDFTATHILGKRLDSNLHRNHSFAGDMIANTTYRLRRTNAAGTLNSIGYEIWEFVDGTLSPGAANPKGPLGHPLHGPFGGPI